MKRRKFLTGLIGIGIGSTATWGRGFRTGLTRYAKVIRRAEARATPEGRHVLIQGRTMVENYEIVRGSCWNWLDTVYRHSGYRKSGRTILFASRKKGPYASLGLLRPGDWIYHVNHSYGDIEHSGMFVDWLDRKRHIALMLSYGGEGRRKPGRYRPYDITHTYRIIRPTGAKR
jgi:hypothetical protein